MPTHKDLLNAEVAFVLYNGQVYMTHPTDSDVSLPRLLEQVETLNHLPSEVTLEINDFLRGGPPPQGLDLVGRYNMTNGRIAPYGPVNSPENQERVRQAIQQAAYDSPASSQEPVSADPGMGMVSSVDNWRMARQFMPLVNKIGQDDCPFCGQKRSLYHMKDSYLAQAMGVYGHGLCRDCLTTRMDQHELTSGQRIAGKRRMSGFRLVSADVTELANKMLRRLYLEQNFTDPYHTPREDESETRREQKFVDLMEYLLKEAPETYKLWPFVFRSYKKDNIGGSTAPAILWHAKEHVKDILQQATVHSERLKDDPRPEVRVPNFMAEMKPRRPDEVGDNPTLGTTSWSQLQNWVYEQNALNGSDEADQAEQTVFEWPDGWTIKKLGSDALAREGELMGHCVGGYCQNVNSQNSHIYSLRDPKNAPHVTFEVEGQVMYAPINSDRTQEEEHNRVLERKRQNLDPSTYQPALGMRAYQQEHRPALTAPPYPVELFPGQQDYHINHPNNEGSPDAHTAFPPWDIIQIMGKQDSEPIPEYRARIKEFISHLRTEGVQAQWHPTDAVHPNDERNEVVDDIYDLMEYYNDYRDGNYENHDYPSITQQRQREGLDDGTDDYGLPPHQHEDDGLYVGRDSIENIVLQAIKHFTENDRNRWYHNDLQYSPDEIAQGLIFLLNELKIQNRPVLNRPYLNWDDTMNAAIEEGEKEIDKQIDEIRELNYDYEWGKPQRRLAAGSRTKRR
jgi:hypothetical protein